MLEIHKVITEICLNLEENMQEITQKTHFMHIGILFGIRIFRVLVTLSA